MHIRSPRRFCGCLGAISVQSCNLDWQWIAYNQPKKLFWTAKNDQWGDLREKPDEFTDWERRIHTHSILLIRADGSICAVDSECRAAKTLCSLLCVLSTLRGLTRQPMINTSLTQTTGLLAVKSQSVANSLDISHGELHSLSTSVERV